jgi:3-oxoadipate enol-lactonase
MVLRFDRLGSGVPLVLLHAFPLSRLMWEPQRVLADSCEWIVPDLPGFGESALDATVSIEGMADAVAKLPVDQSMILGGCSMGGYVALAFARKYPDRLRGLVLIDTKPEPDDETARAKRNQMIDSADSLTAFAVIEGMIPKALGPTTRKSRPETVEQFRKLGSSQPVAGIIAAQRAMRDRADSQPFLAEIRVPTLVIVGEEDEIAPPEGAKRMADRIPGSELCIIPNSGHLPNWEEPVRFNAVLGSFVNRLTI